MGLATLRPCALEIVEVAVATGEVTVHPFHHFGQRREVEPFVLQIDQAALCIVPLR
jgi:hypothetical protein